MHQHPRAGAAFSHALCSQSSYPFCFSPTLEFFFVVTRMIYQNRWKKRFCVWRSPLKKSCSNEIFIRTGFESFEREGQRGGGRRSRVQGKRFREELLRQSDRAQSRVLILVRKETSPAIERVPISPPHLLRIVALSRQPDLHGECTYGRLYRGPYEKRDATLAFAEKKGKKKIGKKEERGLNSRAHACVLFIANSIHPDQLHRNAPRLFGRLLILIPCRSKST